VNKLFHVASMHVLILSTSICSAQQPSPQPLQAMPYSPSLDLTSLDKTADPCVNFYDYACGGWKKNNPIPADQASWDVYAKLANENQQFLWGILVDDAKAKGRTPIQQKVGDYFAACMDTTAIDARGDKPILPALARVDALTTRPALIAALASLHHDYAGSSFFRSGTGQDAVDSSTVIAEIGAGGIGLPDREYYLKTDPNMSRTSRSSSPSLASRPTRPPPMRPACCASKPPSPRRRLRVFNNAIRTTFTT
jgi:putative endopeptidase